MMEYNLAMSLAALYQCLSHPDRIRIIALLQARPLCVRELQSILRLSQVEVSKHLAHLRRRGFVVASSSGTWRFYQLPEVLPFELDRHLRCLRECLNHANLLRDEFDRLRALPGKSPKKQLRKRAPAAAVPLVEPPMADLTALEDHLL